VSSGTDASERPRLLAIRHAPTLADGVCVGDAEVPCAMTAEDAATYMRVQAAGLRVACVWSSPRLRCLGPASSLATELKVPLNVDERLREINLGVWQGRTWADIQANDLERFASWAANWTCAAPPAGETTSDLLARVGSWWNELPGGVHMLVAHAGVIRALRVVVRGDSWLQAMQVPAACLQGEWFERGPACARAVA
jgi:alpha-ribazole phosphatase